MPMCILVLQPSKGRGLLLQILSIAVARKVLKICIVQQPSLELLPSCLSSDSCGYVA